MKTRIIFLLAIIALNIIPTYSNLKVFQVDSSATDIESTYFDNFSGTDELNLTLGCFGATTEFAIVSLVGKVGDLDSKANESGKSFNYETVKKMTIDTSNCTTLKANELGFPFMESSWGNELTNLETIEVIITDTDMSNTAESGGDAHALDNFLSHTQSLDAFADSLKHFILKHSGSNFTDLSKIVTLLTSNEYTDGRSTSTSASFDLIETIEIESNLSTTTPANKQVIEKTQLQSIIDILKVGGTYKFSLNYNDNCADLSDISLFDANCASSTIETTGSNTFKTCTLDQQFSVQFTSNLEADLTDDSDVSYSWSLLEKQENGNYQAATLESQQATGLNTKQVTLKGALLATLDSSVADKYKVKVTATRTIQGANDEVLDKEITFSLSDCCASGKIEDSSNLGQCIDPPQEEDPQETEDAQVTKFVALGLLGLLALLL